MAEADEVLGEATRKRQPARRAKLTKTLVEKIPVPPDRSTRELLWDTEVTGFGVQVTNTGSRSYFIQYRIGGRRGKNDRYTIGKHGNPFTVDQARTVAREKMMLVRQGIDPKAEKQRRLDDLDLQRRLAEELNFERLAREFLKAKDGLRSRAEYESIFDRVLIPRFCKKSVTEIRRDDVHAMNDEMGAISESSANKAFARLKAFLNWATDKKERHFPYTPISKMKLPFAEGKRTRFLSEAEVRYLWLASESLPAPVRGWLQMLILTGLRVREVARARWSEINLDAREWIIPPDRMKNKKSHLVPLTDKMIAILKGLGPTAAHRRGFVFTINGSGPINSFSKTKELIEAGLSRLIGREFERHGSPLPEASTLKDWVYHDLRRTLTTHLLKEGESVTTTEAILSHALPGVSQVADHYVVYNFAKEKREALEKWSLHVERIVANDVLFEVPTQRFEGVSEEDVSGLLAMESITDTSRLQQIDLLAWRERGSEGLPA